VERHVYPVNSVCWSKTNWYHRHFIECNLFSPWYSCKNAKLALNNNRWLTQKKNYTETMGKRTTSTATFDCHWEGMRSWELSPDIVFAGKLSNWLFTHIYKIKQYGSLFAFVLLLFFVVCLVFCVCTLIIPSSTCKSSNTLMHRTCVFDIQSNKLWLSYILTQKINSCVMRARNTKIPRCNLKKCKF
jgi:hypothetical protein